MELIKNIIAIAFCLVIASCIKNNNYSVITDASKQLHCNIDSSYHIKKLSEVCDSVTFIPLETKNEAILGAIDKMIVDSTQIYILSSNKLYVYDKYGNYKFIVSRLGHANNEYLEINDFCISRSSLMIADTQSKKIMIFSKDGMFQKTIGTTLFPEFIASVNDSLLAVSCSGTEGYRLSVLDLRKEIVNNGFFRYDKRFSSSIPQTFTRSSDNELYYKQPFSNCYYHIQNDGSVELSYVMDFQKYNFKESDLAEMNIIGCKILYDKEGNANILRFNESSNYYQLEFVCERYAKDGQFIMLISKRNQRRYLINSNDYTDDLTFYNFRILPDFSCLHEQKYWGVIYPASWRECFNGTEVQSPSAQYKKIRKYISSISDEQNPIICVYHIKQSLF